MSAKELFTAGRLSECLTELKSEVRRDPADVGRRLFLFQLLCVLGQWDPALNSLSVLAELSPRHRYLERVYGPAIRCEAQRRAVFDGAQLPPVLGEPEPWVGQMIEANRVWGEGDPAGSESLRRRALEAAPAVAGTVNGRPFQWLADADPRTGPLLEAVIDGQYYWVPLHRLRELRSDPPAELRDVVWLPAQLIWENGGTALALLPARYPGSEASPDPSIVLGRKTDWAPAAAGAVGEVGGVAFGLGQRLLATDAEDYPFLEVRNIALGGAVGGGAAPAVG